MFVCVALGCQSALAVVHVHAYLPPTPSHGDGSDSVVRKLTSNATLEEMWGGEPPENAEGRVNTEPL